MKHCSILSCLLFALAVNSFDIAKAQVDVNDSLALVDLYNSTNGPEWFESSNWLTTNPVSTWYGITVSDSRVITINLDANNLSGTLPASIGNLVNLEYLDFWNNQLSGTIPSSIGNLVNLEDLDLTFNHFSGNIPAAIGNLKN